MKRVATLLSAMFFAACSESPPRPTTPTGPTPVFSVSGVVREGRTKTPVAGAVVEALSLRSTAPVVTSDAGAYALGGLAGYVVIRATKDGYAPDSKQLEITRDVTQDLLLQPGVDGAYDLTFIASATCVNLAAIARSRTYTATISQNAGALDVVLSGAQFVKQDYCGPSDRFTGSISGDVLTFQITRGSPPCEDWNGVTEVLPTGAWFDILGRGAGTSDGSSISGIFD